MTATAEPRRESLGSVDGYRPFPKKLNLICAQCQHEASYIVGVVVVPPAYAEAMKTNPNVEIGDFVCFTNAFRCHKCHQGSRWVLTEDSKQLIMFSIIMAGAGLIASPVQLLQLAAFDGTPVRTGAENEDYVLAKIAADPTNGFLRTRLGNIYENCGMDAQAKEQFAKAVELDPTRIDAHFSLGRIAQNAGQTEEARSHFERVIEFGRLDLINPVDQQEALVANALQHLAGLNDALIYETFPTDVRIRTSLEDETQFDPSPAQFVAGYRLDLSTDAGWVQLTDLCLGNPVTATRSKPLTERVLASRPLQAPFDPVAARLRQFEQTQHERDEEPQFVRSFAVGRNDPCPCGSGRKFKKCCG